jgi:hypothetical protein
MSPGRDRIFLRPCLMTCSRWAKPVKATLASGPRLSTDQTRFSRFAIAWRLASADADWPGWGLPGVSLREQAATACDRHCIELNDDEDGDRGC